MKTDGVAATWTDGAAAMSWTEAVKLELQLPDGQRSLQQLVVAAMTLRPWSLCRKTERGSFSC